MFPIPASLKNDTASLMILGYKSVSNVEWMDEQIIINPFLSNLLYSAVLALTYIKKKIFALLLALTLW
jgi:hypothetical protein